MHDIIGDIHGHADELVEMLEKLGYMEGSCGFRHPKRTLIFCGDFIDRGPRIRDTISIARSMCESGAALAVMGNHELNALAFHTPHPTKVNTFLRAHSERNIRQHRATLDQLNSIEMASALDWFRTLPTHINTGDLRVVHACWDDADLATLAVAMERFGTMTPSFLFEATEPGSPVFRAIERVMKGPEIHLPTGRFMVDKEGVRRPTTRIRWFESPDLHNCASYSIPALQDPDLSGISVPESVQPSIYDATNPPVFVGHYWMPDALPAPLASNVACVDYSVAKDGMLAAYRHHGESVLRAENFVTVASRC